MNIKPFCFEEFVKIAYGEKGISIWKDHRKGMSYGSIAVKYGMARHDVSNFLARVYSYFLLYSKNLTKEACFSILLIYCAHAIDASEAQRTRSIRTVMREFKTIEEFLDADENDITSLMKYRGVGKGTIDFTRKLQNEVLKQSRNKTAS